MTLCDISNKFGSHATYGWSSGAQSRWAYLDGLLEHCIQDKQESNLLAFLFSKGQFVNKLRGQTPEVIEYAYTQIVNTVIVQINGVLYFGGNELAQIGKVFDICKLGSTIWVTYTIPTLANSAVISPSNATEVWYSLIHVLSFVCVNIL